MLGSGYPDRHARTFTLTNATENATTSKLAPSRASGFLPGYWPPSRPGARHGRCQAVSDH
jgi:hypothetical protein